MKLFPLAIRRARSAFTMVEIAICLAIIGIALVGIIGVLPYGLNTERDTREETIINQDVATLLPIITQGMRGADDLTNYVYAITNYWTLYNADGTVNGSGVNGYTYGNVAAIASPYPATPYAAVQITNGANIVGILSTPEFISTNYTSSINYLAFPGVFNTNGYNVYSNHIVAYVRSMSGSAAEKPPQNNDIVVGDSFTYRVVIVNAPVALDTNTLSSSSALYSPYNKQIWQNQHELRMTYYWPLLPNGNVGNNRQTFRATVAGQLSATNLIFNQPLYFYQSQSFGANPTQL
jgi:prepilin-type N-terminal cleavage/methylation domain-containing protein